MNPKSNKATWALTASASVLAIAAYFAASSESATLSPLAPQSHPESTIATAEPNVLASERAEREEVGTATMSGFYGAPEGQVMRYDYRAESTVGLRRQQDSDGSSMKVTLRGEMTVTVVARKKDELIAEVCFPVTTGTIVANGSGNSITADDSLARDVARPMFVRMRDDGATLGYAFDAEIEPQHRNWLRGLWSASRFVAKDVEGAPYTTVEDDVVGPADLEYTWLKPFVEDGRVTGGRLARKKLGYAGDRQADLGAVTAQGYGEALLNPSLGWFEKTYWEETVVRQLEEVATEVSTALSASWTLRDIDYRAVDPDESRWQLPWQPVGGDQESALAESSSNLAYEQKRLAGTTLEQLLGDLAAMLQADGDPHEIYGLKHDLTLLLLVRPEALARLEQMLPRLDEDTAALAISAMAATGLPEAEGLVAAMFADPNQSLSNRQAAAWSMVQVMNPSESLVASFAAVVTAAAMHEPGVAEGILALGTLIGRAEAGPQSSGLAALLALESVAMTSSALPNWIEAVGNTALPAALEVARRHRAHADIVVRAATVSAVRLVAGAEAFEFAVAALSDEAALVRTRAAETIIGRPEPQALQVIDTFLQNEADANVRAGTVRILGSLLPDNAAAALLQRIATSDATTEVRQLAVQLLQGN